MKKKIDENETQKIIIITENQFKMLISEGLICDIFSDEVGAQDYDDILNGVGNRKLKDVSGKIVMMTPNEYYDRCAQIQDTTIEDQREFTIGYKVDSLVRAIEKGNKLSLPFLDYGTMQQEGRHRVGAAEKYGCKEVPVAVFFKNGQEDPYYVGWNGEEERSMGLDSMLGKWSDLKKDDNGSLYIEYNIKDYGELRLFLDLYPPSDDKDDILNFIEYGANRKIGDYNFIEVGEEEFRFSENVPELTRFIIGTINAGVNREDLYRVWDDKEYVDQYLDNGGNDFQTTYYILKSVAQFGMRREITVSDKIIKVYKAVKKMINSLCSYIFLYHNINYFTEYLRRDYRVDIDQFKSIIKVYCDEKFNNVGDAGSGKEFLKKEKVLVTDELPRPPLTGGRYVIPKKLVVDYIKIYR